MKGDCLERMKEIPDKSVDMVLTDPPYGTTANKWDSILPFQDIWREIKRVLKDNGPAVVLFGSEPFSSLLRQSNIKEFKYDWIWKKSKKVGHLNAKFQPMNGHETISVFCKGRTFYYPQGLRDIKPIRKTHSNNGTYGSCSKDTIQKITGYPSTVLEFPHDKSVGHPTQKPVALLEYLIKTYTLEDETVLDFTMGSGSTGVACKNLNRNFIGIERDDKYFEIAKTRIEEA